MGFTVRDEEVIRLADELKRRLHLDSRTDAIRYALKAAVTQSRTNELLNVLQSEIWPLLNDGSPISKAEREQILD